MNSMETAPKDGRVISLWLNNGDHNYWIEASWGQHTQGTGWRYESEGRFYNAVPSIFMPEGWKCLD
jgi:hypothetical protein